jgi:hypothetical protein
MGSKSPSKALRAETGFAGLRPPPPSPPKLAVEDSVRAAPASLRIGLVSWAGFWAPVSGDKDPVPGGGLGKVRSTSGSPQWF